MLALAAAGRRIAAAAGWRRSEVACRGPLAPRWLRARMMPATGDHENRRDQARLRGMSASSRRVSLSVAYRDSGCSPAHKVLGAFLTRHDRPGPSPEQSASLPSARRPGRCTRTGLPRSLSTGYPRCSAP
jgi:hypothetical protein